MLLRSLLLYWDRFTRAGTVPPSAVISSPFGLLILESRSPLLLHRESVRALRPEIQEQAKHIADKAGYKVLIPDLYKGKMGVDKEEAHHLM